MVIHTCSGSITISKRSAFAKWLTGWMDGGGFTGAATVNAAWTRAQEVKPTGCSWFALGKLMASEQGFGRALEYAEVRELVEAREGSSDTCRSAMPNE